MAAVIFNGNFTKSLKNRHKMANDGVLPGWLLYEFDYLDFQTAALNNTVDLHEILSKGILEKALIQVVQGFQGSGITEIDMSIGPNADLDKHVPPISIINPTDELFVIDEYESLSSDVFTRIDVNSVGANLSALTQGTMNVWLKLSVLPTIAEV